MNMSNHDHEHHKSSHKVLKQISSKISALKGDITTAVRERSHSISSNRHSSMSSDTASTNINTVAFTVHGDTPSVMIETNQTSNDHGK